MDNCVPFPIDPKITLAQLAKAACKGHSKVQVTQFHPSTSVEQQTVSLEVVSQMLRSIRDGELAWPLDKEASCTYTPESGLVFQERFL